MQSFSLLVSNSCVSILHSNLNSSNTGGSFTLAPSNFFLSPYEIATALENKIFKEAFSFYYESVCCAYSLESPRRGDSNDYTQHVIIV